MGAVTNESSVESGAVTQAKTATSRSKRVADDMGPVTATSRILLLFVLGLFFGLPLLWLLLAPTKDR